MIGCEADRLPVTGIAVNFVETFSTILVTSDAVYVEYATVT